RRLARILAAHVVQTPGELLPSVCTKPVAGLYHPVHLRPKPLIVPLRSCKADDREWVWHQVLATQGIEARNQLAPCQITGRSKDHHDARLRRLTSRQPGVLNFKGFLRHKKTLLQPLNP